MYHLPEFKASNDQEVIDFMQAHPFVMIVGKGDVFPIATHVPVEVQITTDESGAKQIQLIGHIQQKSNHHKAFEQDNNVLVIFSGAHAYVSASWYTNPNVASTWNYQAVHAQGEIKLLDEAETLQIIKDVTQRFEQHMPNPSLVQNMPDEYVRQHVKAIVGFSITIQAYNHVFKLSQNRDAENYQKIKEQLSQGDADAQQIAREMSRVQETISS